jgi:hypothetical protein
MTEEEIKAALTLAAEAKTRADAATPGPWLHVAVTGQTRRSTALNIYTADVQQLIVSDSDTLDTAEFIAAARRDVPALADLVRRLADELLIVRAILSDAMSESRMYRHGYEQAVKDALPEVDKVGQATVNDHPWVNVASGRAVYTWILTNIRTLLLSCPT